MTVDAENTSRRSRWLYVLFNEEAKRPVVLPLRGEGPRVILVWSTRDGADRFLRSLPADKQRLWRAYEWTAEDVSTWIRRDRSLAGVEMDARAWPAGGSVFVERELYE